MMIDHFCTNCNRNRELDIHGACDVCGSFQVVRYPGQVEAVYIPEEYRIDFAGIVGRVFIGALFLLALLSGWAAFQR